MLTLSSSAGGPAELGPPPVDTSSGRPASQPSTSLRPSDSGRGASWLLRSWASGWWAVAMRGPDILLSAVAVVLLVLGVIGLFTIPGAGVGLLLLVPAIWGLWGLGRVKRHLLLAFTGVDIGPRAPGASATWMRVLGIDRPRLASVGWGGLQALWGLVAASIVIGLVTQAVGLVSVPLIARWAPEGTVNVWFASVSTPLGYAVAALAGLLVLLLMPWLARALAQVDIALARWLIGVDPQRQLHEMTRRVDTLTTTREETIDSVEAERRRIERDLHDGPQQRLVSIAMTLGLAQTQLDRDPEAARALIDEAHAASKEAIIEMRQVARGIVPPILADRGLDAAVSALADRSPVPVTVTSRFHERLDPTIEAIAYFCVSEALTNVAKHAGATRATIDLGTASTARGERLAVTVTDDGTGGAVVGAGSGLTGLRQRVASVDGDLHVHSPRGGGTTVAITLPLRRRTP